MNVNNNKNRRSICLCRLEHMGLKVARSHAQIDVNFQLLLITIAKDKNFIAFKCNLLRATKSISKLEWKNQSQTL